MIGTLFRPWTEAHITIVDVETTGPDVYEDHVVEVGAAIFRNGRCVEVLESYVQPPEGIVIKPEATEVHGIYDADVQGAPSLQAILGRWYGKLAGTVPGAYCESFDRQMFELKGHHPFPKGMPWIDPLPFVRMADAYVAGSGRHKLEATCKRYGVKLDDAHSAGNDARAAGELLFRLLDKGVLQDHWTLAELLLYQQKKVEKQQREYDAYQRKVEHATAAGQSREHTCHWPGCKVQVPPAMWGCKPHWFTLPKRLRDLIWAAYEPGQEETGRPSTRYLRAADEVQRWIADNG